MNKKQILKMLLLLKERGGTGGSFNNFYRTDRSKFENTQDEVELELQKLLEIRCIDHNHRPTAKLDEYIKQVQKEVDKEEEIDDLILGKTRHEAKLAKWQVKAFWPMFILAVLGGGYSIFDIAKPDDSINKEEMMNVLKDYKTKKEFEDDLINALDLIYSDTTIVNEKRKPQQ
jgi:hypothetical protein